MKNNHTLLLYTASILLLTACGTKKQNLVVGSWKLADLSAEMPKDMPDSTKMKEQEEIKGETEAMKKVSFDFNKDGTYSIGEHKGSWKINEEGTQLTFIDNEKKEEKVSEVIELTATKFVATRMDDGVKETFTLTR